MVRVKTFACEYCGVVAAEGNVDAGALARASSYVAYRWAVHGDGFEEQHVSHMRVNEAACKGVAFQFRNRWRTTVPVQEANSVIAFCEDHTIQLELTHILALRLRQ